MAFSDVHPGSIMEISGAYWATCTLHAGVKLGVFTAIGDAAATAKDIARQTAADPRAMAMLLDALTGMELLEKDGDRYTNTPAAKTFLSRDSDRYVGYMIMHHHHLVESWAHLDEAVATGRPVRSRASFEDVEVRESFLMGMFNNASITAPLVVREIDFGDRRHLLDLGGGPGTFSIHFCRKYPDLRATVFDLPTTRPFAEKTIARFGLSERIDFQEGDYTRNGIAGTFDAAWLSHILHGEEPAVCREIIKKTVAVLKPGSPILIHEFILDDTRAAPLFPTLFSLNMLLGTHGGQAYSEGELTRMLAENGVTDIHRLPFRSPTDSGILMGRGE